MPEVNMVELTLRERLLLQTLLAQEKENLEAINRVLYNNISNEETDIYKISLRQNEREIREIEALIKRLGRDDC
jgi:hypothetical protein